MGKVIPVIVLCALVGCRPVQSAAVGEASLPSSAPVVLPSLACTSDFSGLSGEQAENARNYAAVRRTIQKLQLGVPVKIAILGDSLVGAGGADKWPELLFNKNRGDSEFSIYKDFQSATVLLDDYSLGGTTAHYGATLLGKSSVAKGTPASFAEEVEAKTPFKERGYDLVIVGFGMNGGAFRQSFNEEIVRSLRSNGSEVIVLTQHPRLDNENQLKEDREGVFKIARAYGAAVADSWSLMSAARASFLAGKGERPYGENDLIHQSAFGARLYARALRGVLSESASAFGVDCTVSPGTRVISEAGYQPSQTLYVSEPLETDAPARSTVPYLDVPTSNLSVFFGRSSTPLDLPEGRFATFGTHESAMGMDIVLAKGGEFKADIESAVDGSLIGRIDGRVPNAFRLFEAVPLTGRSLKGVPIRIRITSGRAAVAGVVFFVAPS